jgi:hypothetical protein
MQVEVVERVPGPVVEVPLAHPGALHCGVEREEVALDEAQRVGFRRGSKARSTMFIPWFRLELFAWKAVCTTSN